MKEVIIKYTYKEEEFEDFVNWLAGCPLEKSGETIKK